MEEYESSKQCFELSAELAQKQGKKDVSAQNRWIRKCESEIEGKMDNMTLFCEPRLNTLFAIFTEEAEEEERIAATTKKIETPKVAPAAAAPVPQMSKKVLPDIRYQYYQSATSMNISVMAKNLTADDVVVEFSTNHLLVRVKQDGNEGMCRERCFFIWSLLFLSELLC